MLDFIVRLAVFADEQKSTSAGCSGRCGEAYHRAGKRLYFFQRRFQHIDTRFRNSAVVGRPSCNEGLSEKELSGRNRLKSVPWDREDRFGRSCFADGSFHASCGSRLQRDLPQFVLFEMRSHFDPEIDCRNDCQAGSEKVGPVQCGDFAEVTAQQQRPLYPSCLFPDSRG